MKSQTDARHRRKHGRFGLLRDATVFQLKLFVDGFRDLLLAPISIVLAMLDFITNGDRFYRLLNLGRRSDHWINLFGASEKDTGLDDAVERVERAVAEQYRNGKIPASARESLLRAVARLEGLRKSQGVTERQSASARDEDDPAV